MRLAACVPTIPVQLVSSLEKCGIRTDTDLLFSGSTWDIFRRLPAGTTTLQGLEEAKALVATLASAPGQSATEMTELSEPDDDGFLTGLPPLDEILNGLTNSRRLIEVSGDKGSGKTSFVLQLVLHHLVYHPHSSVLWVDTTGDFPAARASEILELFDEPDALRALERLQVSSAFEVDSVYEVLEELRFSFGETPPPDFKIRGIVIDTIASLFGPILSPVSSQGHAIMTGFMHQLRAFAQSFSLAVFVINNSVAFTPFVPGAASNNPNIRKPALGVPWSQMQKQLAMSFKCIDPKLLHRNHCVFLRFDTVFFGAAVTIQTEHLRSSIFCGKSESIRSENIEPIAPVLPLAPLNLSPLLLIRPSLERFMRSFLSSVSLGKTSARQAAKQTGTTVTFQPFVESRAMSDLYEVQFTWPSTEPSVVVVTGSFDEWSSSVHLVKGADGWFHGSAKIPWDTKIAYKYVVDSQWVCETSSPTETDEGGNINNVFTSPPKPSGASEAPVVANGDASEKMETSPPVAADSPPSEVKDTNIAGEEAGPDAGTTLSQVASDFVDTVAARDGTTSALSYVTSALGAAIQSQIGVDPINATQIAVETPKPDAQFIVPEPPLADTPVPAPEPIMASVVPISIVPVNADENNTFVETPAAEAQVATEPSQPVETPSTHTPAPPVDVLPEPVPIADAPSVPEVVETVVSKNNNIEAPTPSQLPVSPSSEPPTVSAVVSEPTLEPAAPVVSEPTSEPAATSAVISEPTAEPAATSAGVLQPTADPAATSAVVSEPTPELAATSAAVSEQPPISGQESKATEVAVAEASPEPTSTQVAVSEPISEPAAISPEPASTSPVLVTEPAAPAATEEAKPSTNGAAPTSTSKGVSSSPPPASAPATPTKKNGHAFPSSETESPSSSTANSPSKFGTLGSRKNRKSIFGKIKGIFNNDKDKEEKEKK